MEKSHALKLLSYDYWANCQVFATIESDAVETLSEIESVLSHILGAKSIWYKRIIKESAPKDLFDTKNIKTLIELNLQLKDNWNSLLTIISTDKLISYQNLNGDHHQSHLSDVLTHVINHGSYHRGQVARILREAGITPKSTDFIVFCRE